ncbi:hypothetical protein [Tenacibaculum jejuense]|uniref:Uncharacterized protein n=1 Tax=Tenacibaculum jejuense TaxID=584609 RepID=A0A238UF45_9FLAO|nr:hypothetical protein [Tenacibaculum jejuense]SNR17722.1 protein of unknown function [Tenacibaculum jejuense]
MKKSKEELKSYFEKGDKPTQAQYADLIDSFIDEKQPLGEANRTFNINENGEINLVSQQSNWTQSDATQPDYIKNKPELEKLIKVPTRNYVLKSHERKTTNGDTYECKVPLVKMYGATEPKTSSYFMSADFQVTGKTNPGGEIAIEFVATTEDGTVITEKIGLPKDNITDVGGRNYLERISGFSSFFGDALLRSLTCNLIIDVPDTPRVLVSNIYFGSGNVAVDWQPAFEDSVSNTSRSPITM